MERHHVVNLLGVTRCVGYALALVAAAVAIALLVLAPFIGLPHHVFAAPLMLTVLAGLMVAWMGGLSRLLVRRMTFETGTDP